MEANSSKQDQEEIEGIDNFNEKQLYYDNLNIQIEKLAENYQNNQESNLIFFIK